MESLLKGSTGVGIAIATLLFGGIILIIILILNRRKNEEDESNVETEPLASAEESDSKDQNKYSTVANKKSKQKKKRETQQEFSHPWLVSTLKGHTAQILDVDISSNGKYLASSAEDRTVLIWCIKDILSKDKKSLRINVEYDDARLVKWSPDGKAFIIHKLIANIVEVYKLVKKSDGSFGSATKVIEFPKHHENDDVISLEIACNGKYIVTCSKNNDLAVWDLKGQILTTICTNFGTTHRARISPCGRFVAASGFTPDVKFWDVQFSKSGEFNKVAQAFTLGGHSSGVYDFAFNSDTSRTATVSKDGTYRLYDTRVEFEKGEDPKFISSGQWEGKSSSALIALSPNAEVIAIAHGSSLSTFSTVNGQHDKTINDIFDGPIIYLTFDSAGDYILVAGDRHVKILRNITGCRAAIDSAKKKLKQRQTSATQERLEKTIEDCQQTLEEFGESSVE